MYIHTHQHCEKKRRKKERKKQLAKSTRFGSSSSLYSLYVSATISPFFFFGKILFNAYIQPFSYDRPTKSTIFSRPLCYQSCTCCTVPYYFRAFDPLLILFCYMTGYFTFRRAPPPPLQADPFYARQERGEISVSHHLLHNCYHA